jgi:hypothetical protein
MFSAAKDAMTSRAAQSFVNTRIARYGQLQDFRIDSGARRIEGVCQLRGENEPIRVVIDRYEVTERGGKKYIELKGCQCGRPWLQALIEDYALNRPIEVPPWAASAL